MMTRFFADERGATAIEYATIAGLISIVIIGASMTWADNTTNMFDMIRAAMP